MRRLVFTALVLLCMVQCPQEPALANAKRLWSDTFICPRYRPPTNAELERVRLEWYAFGIEHTRAFRTMDVKPGHCYDRPWHAGTGQLIGVAYYWTDGSRSEIKTLPPWPAVPAGAGQCFANHTRDQVPWPCLGKNDGEEGTYPK